MLRDSCETQATRSKIPKLEQQKNEKWQENTWKDRKETDFEYNTLSGVQLLYMGYS